MNKLSGKVILITGGTGSFGRAMVDRLLQTISHEFSVLIYPKVRSCIRTIIRVKLLFLRNMWRII